LFSLLAAHEYHCHRYERIDFCQSHLLPGSSRHTQVKLFAKARDKPYPAIQG
jgi:hypothetical protein